MGDDSPAPTTAFQRTFWLGPNSTGGLPSPIPEEFGPLNWGHSAAPAKLDRTKVATTTIQEARVMTIYPLGGLVAFLSPLASGAEGVAPSSILDLLAGKMLGDVGRDTKMACQKVTFTLSCRISESRTVVATFTWTRDAPSVETGCRSVPDGSPARAGRDERGPRHRSVKR
jgi:hypothetical protein